MPTSVDMEPISDKKSLKRQAIRELAHLFKLLSDETRLRILDYLLADGELHVRALCELLDQSQPAVSHHLALLRVANLIESRRDGKHNYYRVINERVENLVGMLSRRPEDTIPFDLQTQINGLSSPEDV